MFVDENVVTFDITVDNVTRVQVLQAKQPLPQNVLADILRVRGVQFGDQRRQGVVHDLNEDPQTALELVLLVDAQDEVIFAAHVHQGHLIDHQLLFALILQILDELERDLLVVALTFDFENFGEPSGSQFVFRGDLVVQRRVIRLERCVRRYVLGEGLSRWHAALERVVRLVAFNCFGNSARQGGVHGDEAFNDFLEVFPLLLIGVVIAVGVYLDR